MISNVITQIKFFVLVLLCNLCYACYPIPKLSLNEEETSLTEKETSYNRNCAQYVITHVVREPCNRSCEYHNRYNYNYENGCYYHLQLINEIINRTITCSNMTSSDMKDLGDSFVEPTKMVLTNSNLPILASTKVRHWNLTYLSIAGCNVEKIVPGFFTGIIGLGRLDISYNKLTDIVEGIFSSLSDLKFLNLSNNYILNVEEHTFSGLISLETLDISKNNISKVHRKSFDMLQNLKHINISSNSLHTINVNFSFGKSFEELSLGSNYLTSIDLNLYKNISVIDFSDNKISEVINWNSKVFKNIDLSRNNLTSIKKLQTNFLNMSHNYINTLEDNVLHRDLVILDLSHNLIDNISEKTFFNLKNLKNLHLQSNQIETLPTLCFKDLTVLEYLDISNNRISKVQYGLFNNLKSLTVLIASNNSLKNMQVNALLTLSSLEYLDIAGNSAKDLDLNPLTLHVKNLREISIQGNFWTCEKLSKVIHSFELHHIKIREGDTFAESNILGIKCSEEISEKYDAMTQENNNEERKSVHTSSSLENYFDKDFKATNFYKYLENFKQTNSVVEFDKKFKDSNIYQFFTSLKDSIIQELKSDYKEFYMKSSESLSKILKNITIKKEETDHNVTNSPLESFSSTLKNNTFLDFLNEGFKNTNFYKFFQNNISNSQNNEMIEYYQNGFKKSNFFKYLENYRITVPSNEIEAVNPKTEKLIQVVEKESKSNVVFVNILSNIIQLFTLIFMLYVFLIWRKYQKASREQIQLV